MDYKCVKYTSKYIYGKKKIQSKLSWILTRKMFNFFRKAECKSHCNRKKDSILYNKKPTAIPIIVEKKV